VKVEYDTEWEIEQIENAISYYNDFSSFFPKKNNLKKKLKSLYDSLFELKKHKTRKLD